MNYSNNKSNYVDKSRFTIVDYPIVPNNDTTPITEIDYVNFGNVSNFGYNNARFSTWETALEVFENYVDNLNSKIISLQAQIDELRESSQRTYVGFRWTGGAVTPETVSAGQTAVLTRGTFEALYSDNTTEPIPVSDITFRVSSGRISGTTITPPVLNSNEYGRTVYVYANYNGERQSISYTVTATRYESLKAKIVNNGVESDIEQNVIQPVSPSSLIDISNIRIYGVDEFNNEDNITSSVTFTVNLPAILNGLTISMPSSGSEIITLTAHYRDLSQVVKKYQLLSIGPAPDGYITWTGGSVNAVDQNNIIPTHDGVITVYGGTEMTLIKGSVTYINPMITKDVTERASFILTANGISETIEDGQFTAPNIPSYSGECTISVSYNGMVASNVLTFKSIFRQINPPVSQYYAYAGIGQLNQEYTENDFNITTVKPTSIHWPAASRPNAQIFIYPTSWGTPEFIMDGEEYNPLQGDGFLTVPAGYTSVYATGPDCDLYITWN